jgi:hypothetical protein
METSGGLALPLAIAACYQMQNGMQSKIPFVAVVRVAGENKFFVMHMKKRCV